MKKLKYEELQNIDIKATNKLLIYIDSIVDIPKLYMKVNENFNFFKDESSRLAFNSWLTMDYIPEDGSKFIESFLNKIPSNLNQLERIVLKGKSKSHISLLEIKKVYNEYIVVNDTLTNLEYKLWEPELKGLMKEGEVFLARIGKSLDYHRFIGDINYLPLSVKSNFMENLLIDFNILRKNNPLMDIGQYLKENTLNVYRIYEEAILNIKDIEYEDDYLLFSQLEEFESFLSAKQNSIDVKNHMHNLMTIYEYKLEDENMTIRDIALIDLDEFLREAIEDEFIFTREEFNSYVNTLKSYIRFLNSIEKEHKDAYKKIIEISQNRFKYTHGMTSHSKIFELDEDLIKITGKFLDNKMVMILKDFDSFLAFVDSRNPKLTKKNKFINRRNLNDINKALRIISKPLSKAPNQNDYPLIDLFYFVSLNLDLTKIDDDRIELEDNINYFFRLKDEEKYSLLCRYLLNGEFMKEKFPEQDIVLLDDGISNFEEFLFKIENLKDNSNLLIQLTLLNILKIKNSKVKTTSFGRAIINYLIEKNKAVNKSNIIYFENLKKANSKL